MSRKKNIASFAVITLAAATGLAYAADPLPPTLNGHWFNNQGSGRNSQSNYEVKLVIEKQAADGTIEGKFTRWGNNCGAKDEPFTGKYDGKELSFHSTVHPNVNTRKMNGGPCGAEEYVLTRSTDGKTFEGKFGDAGAARNNEVVLKP
jgi:hypothetical protein